MGEENSPIIIVLNLLIHPADPAPIFTGEIAGSLAVKCSVIHKLIANCICQRHYFLGDVTLVKLN